MERDIDELIKLLQRYCKYLHLHTSIVATDEILLLFNKMKKENNPFLENMTDEQNGMLNFVFNYQERIKQKCYPKG